MQIPNLESYNVASLPGLWQEYAELPRQLAFAAENEKEARTWQQTLRSKLAELLGNFPAQRCDLDPRWLATVEHANHRRQTFMLQTLPGEWMPVHVLTPTHSAPPFKPVIALHGHGAYGAWPVINEVDSEPARANLRQLNYDYAYQLVQRGYIVFVPVQRGFGERMEDIPWRDQYDGVWASSCRTQSLNALLLGKTLLGLRVWDTIRLLDWIEQFEGVTTTSLGCVGLSGGGMVGLFSAALDTRITCSVVSGYFNSFRTSIMPIAHCPCNYVPGIVQQAEMVDIAGLLAPRPLLIESGDQDAIFPQEHTRIAFAALQSIYAKFYAQAHIDADYFAGGHQWSGAKAYDWLQDHM